MAGVHCGWTIAEVEGEAPARLVVPPGSALRSDVVFLDDLDASLHLHVQLWTKPHHVVFADAVVSTELHHFIQARTAGLKVAVDTGIAAADSIHLSHVGLS
jgi:hypothetical protein